MDRSLLVESTPQIDFKNTRNEDVDETSRKGNVDYSECNFTDLFNIPNNIDEDQHSSFSDNESDTKTNENETDEGPPKKRK